MSINRVRNVAPFINVKFYVTEKFGEPRGSRYHKAVDLATSGGYNNLYSIMDGTVITKTYNSSFGNYIIVKNNISQKAYLYAHMKNPALVNVGDYVYTGQQIGIEGTTGDSTGPHVHLEMQDLTNRSWYFGYDISKYLNPCDFLGIDNIYYSAWIYDGNPTPTPTPVPVPTYQKRKSFPWFIKR